MAKVRSRVQGDAGGCRAILASGRVPVLPRLLGKNNPHDEHGQLEKKNANRFAITTFQAVEGQEMAPLGVLALEWAPGTC